MLYFTFKSTNKVIKKQTEGRIFTSDSIEVWIIKCLHSKDSLLINTIQRYSSFWCFVNENIFFSYFSSKRTNLNPQEEDWRISFSKFFLHTISFSMHILAPWHSFSLRPKLFDVKYGQNYFCKIEHCWLKLCQWLARIRHDWTKILNIKFWN